ncbi:hypothetical protein BsWGS_04026 [Bradybaena similaris]
MTQYILLSLHPARSFRTIEVEHTAQLSHRMMIVSSLSMFSVQYGLSSLHSEQVHRCSDLLCSSSFSIQRLIVPVRCCLMYLLVHPVCRSFLAAPLVSLRSCILSIDEDGCAPVSSLPPCSLRVFMMSARSIG